MQIEDIQRVEAMTDTKQCPTCNTTVPATQLTTLPTSVVVDALEHLRQYQAVWFIDEHDAWNDAPPEYLNLCRVIAALTEVADCVRHWLVSQKQM